MAGFLLVKMFGLCHVINLYSCIMPFMTERKVRGLTHEKIAASAKKPSDVRIDHWEIGLAVVGTLMEMGRPTNVLAHSHVGPDIPNKYQIGKSKVTVEHMPHWGYATVDNGHERNHVRLRLEGGLSTEAVIVNLREAIQNAKGRRKAA